MSCDLTIKTNARNTVEGAERVYDLAEHMGGISFIEANTVECAESVEIGIQLLRACARQSERPRFFFASSACVYPTHLQHAWRDEQGNRYDHVAPKLNELDAWPARPEAGYGFAKLFTEELCRHYAETYDMEVRIARYHNIYGSPGSWNDGKEKSPAALCRKVAEAARHEEGTYEIWGDGKQVRSYLHVSDCVKGTMALMESDYAEPMNIGSDRAISINALADIIEDAANRTDLTRTYNSSGPQGVSLRNADISLAYSVLGWKPLVTLEDGIWDLYNWIEEKVNLNSAA